MKCSDNHVDKIEEDRSVVKSAVQGAAIGAVLWPSLGIAWDTVLRQGNFVAGNRLKFITSQAAMGAVVNGLLNGVLAWWQNRRMSHAEKVTAEKQAAAGEMIQK